MALDADLGAFDRISVGVQYPSADQRTFAEREGPFGFTVAEARGDLGTAGPRRCRTERVDIDFA